MAPTTTTFTTLAKRDSDCTYYDTSCSTHRLAILIIIICIGIIVSAILSLLYVRSRRSKVAKLRAAMQQQHRTKTHDGITTWRAPSDMQGAPPPYAPRRPERVARANGEWI
jgi:hypothetical protein